VRGEGALGETNDRLTLDASDSSGWNERGRPLACSLVAGRPLSEVGRCGETEEMPTGDRERAGAFEAFATRLRAVTSEL